MPLLLQISGELISLREGDKPTIEIVQVEQKMVRIIHDTRVGGIIPDSLDNVHATNQDAPLSERKYTDSYGYPSFPLPESEAMEKSAADG